VVLTVSDISAQKRTQRELEKARVPKSTEPSEVNFTALLKRLAIT